MLFRTLNNKRSDALNATLYTCHDTVPPRPNVTPPHHENFGFHILVIDRIWDPKITPAEGQI